MTSLLCSPSYCWKFVALQHAMLETGNFTINSFAGSESHCDESAGQDKRQDIMLSDVDFILKAQKRDRDWEKGVWPARTCFPSLSHSRR